ncbi:MAG: BON domain-containing protein [Terracidiphilus sp.]
MNVRASQRKSFLLAGVAVLALAGVFLSGCKTQATPTAERTDQQIANDIQAKIQGEQALANQPVQVSVANGVATLSGSVSDEASRALAGNDSGTIPGVKTVVNNLTVQPPAQSMAEPPRQAPARSMAPERRSRTQGAAGPAPAPSQTVATAPQQPRIPQAPPPPAQPVERQIVIPAGTQISVRMVEGLDSKTTQTGDVFHATLAQDLMEQNLVAIPRGAPVLGRVADAKEAAHFKGNAALAIELTQLTAHGQKIELTTNQFATQGAGRGKNTAVKAGGGAALGALIGALAGGGKGAAIGAVAGGGAGAGVNAITRGEQVQIPTESLVQFELQAPIVVNVMVGPNGAVQNEPQQEPQLQHR